MLLAVDASTVVRGSQSQTGFAPLAEHRMIAPPLLWPEASSALRELAWRGTISQRFAAESFDRLLAAPVTPHEPEGLRRDAWWVAEALGWWKTYDAEYVALARLLDCPLLTLDSRLRRGAACVVQVLGPTEL